jgi:hypothetical protein
MRWTAICLAVLAAACGDPEIWVEHCGEGCDAIIHVGEDDAAPQEVRPRDEVDPALLCVPDNDGTITAAEMPVVVNAVASYLVNAQGDAVSVDPAGAKEGDGWVWDFRDGPDAIHAGLRVEPPGGFWFSERFPDADYVSPFSPWDTDLLAAFRAAPGRTEMLGIASRHKDGPAYTLVIYDEPVSLYQFPLTLGTQWVSEVGFSDAVLQGVKNAGTERYEFTVDGRGTLRLPQFTLENTLRIRLDLTQTFVVSEGDPAVRHVWYLYVHECLGEVARIVSLPGETSGSFETAAEFRRLGL